MAKKVITSNDSDGNEVKMVVKKPTAEQLRWAQQEANKTFSTALKNGALLRAKLNDYMREHDLWNEEKEAQLNELIKKLQNAEKQLASGKKDDGTQLKKSEAREIALDMRNWRLQQAQLLSESRQLDQWTCEAQAEDAKFDYLVSQCVVDAETGEQVFKDLDDYKNKSAEQYAVDAASEFANDYFGVSQDWEDSLIENKTLRKLGFTNKDGDLVDEEGHRVDRNGRRIDEQGRYLDESGEHYVDLSGNTRDADGNLMVEFAGFIDDDTGEVIGLESENVTNE